jgi:hypothetical protein
MLQQQWAFGSTYQATGLFTAMLPTCLRRRQVTAWESEGGLRERDPKDRRPFGQRFASTVLTPAGLLHLSLLLLTLAAISYSAAMTATSGFYRSGRQTFCASLHGHQSTLTSEQCFC